MNEEWKAPVRPRDAIIAIGGAIALVIAIAYSVQNHLITHSMERTGSIAFLAVIWTAYFVALLLGEPILARLPFVIGTSLTMFSCIVTPANPWKEWLLMGGVALTSAPIFLSMRKSKQIAATPIGLGQSQEGTWPPPPRLPNEEQSNEHP